jgi:hypothetical protein
MILLDLSTRVKTVSRCSVLFTVQNIFGVLQYTKRHNVDGFGTEVTSLLAAVKRSASGTRCINFSAQESN